jgi:hypothetical protein
MEHNNTLANALKGAVAGAVGVWAMDRLDWFFFEHEDPAARHQTERVRPGGLDPAHVAANKVAGATGGSLHPAQPHPVGIAVHYALGIGPGALYGAFRDRLPVTTEGQDHLYAMGMGLGLFAIQDEALNTLTGLAARPEDYPWQAHGRGLAAHLVFGLVTNAVLNFLGAPPPAPRASVPFSPRYAREYEEAYRAEDTGDVERYDQQVPIKPADEVHTARDEASRGQPM